MLAETALDINIELDLRKSPRGVSRDKVDQFLEGADIYVDCLELSGVSVRRLLFAACVERGFRR